MNSFNKIMVTAAGVIALVVGLSALSALPVKWLWNYLMPELFGLKQITFLQAWGLMILSSFLFKNINVPNTSKA